MPKIKPISPKLERKIVKFGLVKRFEKQINFLKNNPDHPSLNLELLEPKQYGIYSFRIDRKFRALCVFRNDSEEIEVINITVHYR